MGIGYCLSAWMVLNPGEGSHFGVFSLKNGETDSYNFIIQCAISLCKSMHFIALILHVFKSHVTSTQKNVALDVLHIRHILIGSKI